MRHQLLYVMWKMKAPEKKNLVRSEKPNKFEPKFV